MTAPASCATIDLAAYRNNLTQIRKHLDPATQLLAVVKANAYGHGMLPMARAAVEHGVDMLGVATVEEGIALREEGFPTPILLLFQPTPDTFSAVVEYELTVMLADVSSAEKLGAVANKHNKEVSVHCMIDTGMNRQGIDPEIAFSDVHQITRISHLDLQGLATHFPSADVIEDANTQQQIQHFKEMLSRFEREGVPFEQVHLANSAGLIHYPESHGNLVRPGLMTYGVWPGEHPAPSWDLKPVLHWDCPVTQIRHLTAGSTIGYGRTWTCEQDMDVAVLPMGYADGYPHALSNKGEVLIRGQRCPVRGSVCMDQTVVEVTHLEHIEPGDTAILIGSDGDECIRTEDLAAWAETISYEILCKIGERVQREYRD